MPGLEDKVSIHLMACNSWLAMPVFKKNDGHTSLISVLEKERPRVAFMLRDFCCDTCCTTG